MATSDRILRAGIAAAGFLLVGGCTATSQPPNDASTSSSPPVSTPATTPVTSSDEPTSASPTDSAPSVISPTTPLTPADGMCDMVANPNTNTSEPVVVLEGRVNCAEALAVARDYLAAIQRGEPEGQGLFATIRGWDCVWPYVPGRSHADYYLKCTDPTGDNSIRIGD